MRTESMRVSRPMLSVEVVGARNLERHASVDAYCVLQLRPAYTEAHADAQGDPETDALSLSRALRSATAPATASPSWRFLADFAAPDAPPQSRLVVTLYSEKNFFFDMFPKTPNGLPVEEEDQQPDAGPRLSEGCILDAFSGPGEALDLEDPTLTKRRPAKKLSDDGATAGSDSDVLTHSEDDEDEDESPPPSSPSVNMVVESDDGVQETKEGCGAYKSEDAAIGTAEINTALLCRPSRVATDNWYLLRGVNSGEVRVRTLWLDDGRQSLSRKERDAMFAQHLPVDASSRDQYGFAIPGQSRQEWAHLRSYHDCRERRRVQNWAAAFGDDLPDEISVEERSGQLYETLVQLARQGIPRCWRQRVYMSVSGAREKQRAAGSDYYASLVEQAAGQDTETFRQIELDIDRTFGHSGTTICTESGRARLRRILRAYSLRNPDVGYCQGLNFIVGFLTLVVDEEAAFWLLIVVCEDLFPGYYTPAMADIQTDMQVLKQLIAEELPSLNEFTDDVGLPLELLGSQWLLCLFTTTFPAETVFRIFDVIFTEGPHVVFPVILAHLRRLEPLLLPLDDFHAVLSTIKEFENACLDGDALLATVAHEAERIQYSRVQLLREKHRDIVRDERQRAERVRALNQQLAIAYEIPAFSPYAASLLRFYEQAEGSDRSDVAFILALLCHGLVWIAERSKKWTR